MIQDVRLAIRMLARNPAFTLLAVVTLTLGIGANTVVFSLVNAVLFQPLAAREPDRLLTFWHSAPQKGLSHVDLNDAMFAYYRERTRTFENMAAFETGDLALTGKGQPEVLPAAAVTFNYFEVLGREPLIGRTFLRQEDTPNNNNVTVLSYGLWQRRFGADPNIVGQSINLDNKPTIIVGVMPRDFDLPDPNERGSDHTQLWVPKELDPQDISSWNLSVVGRLKGGLTADDAHKEIDALYQSFSTEYDARLGSGALGPNTTTVLMPLKQHIVGDVRRPLLVLLGSIALVLLIACANLTNLLLARSAARTKEIAVRLCLGAGSWRIARQSLVESMLLSFVGAGIGMMGTFWAITGLKKVIPAGLPHVDSIRVDWVVLLFTIALSLITGLLCGLATALRGSRFNLQEMIKEGARGSASASTRRINNTFVVSQLALSLILLIGAALLLQSFRNLLAVNPGFRAENVLMARLSLPEQRYPDEKQVTSFYDQLRQGIGVLPGVKAVELCQVVPFSGDGQGGPFTVEGRESERPKVAWLRSTSSGYFAAMGMPILKGRTFEPSDSKDSVQVAIVDEKLAQTHWPQTDPIGKRLRLGGDPWLTVVGVVPSVKNRSLTEDAWPYVYRPSTQWIRRETMLVIKSSMDPTSLIGGVREQVTKLDAELPLYDVSTVEQAVGRSLSTTRLVNTLLTAFAVTALLLALLGIYGVMSLNVNNRRTEFGIRLALGAKTSNVLGVVLGDGIRLAFIGVVFGLVGAFALTRFLQGLLFGTSATDIKTFVFLSGLMVLVVLLACWIPARRATRVDPLEALRYE